MRFTRENLTAIFTKEFESKNYFKYRINMSEHQEQVALISWSKMMRSRHPELDLLYAIPNGGQRAKLTAVRLQSEGVKAGIPDLCLPVGRGGYHALYVEMKFGKNKPTPLQKETMNALSLAGNKCNVCYSWDEARDVIEKYLSMGTVTQTIISIPCYMNEDGVNHAS
jgi:hypothetical protein